MSHLHTIYVNKIENEIGNEQRSVFVNELLCAQVCSVYCIQINNIFIFIFCLNGIKEFKREEKNVKKQTKNSNKMYEMNAAKIYKWNKANSNQ